MIAGLDAFTMAVFRSVRLVASLTLKKSVRPAAMHLTTKYLFCDEYDENVT